MIRTVRRLAVIAVVAVLLQSTGFLIGTSTSQPDASDPLLRPPTDAGTGLAAGSSFDDYRVMSDPLPAGPAGGEEDAELVPETPEDVAILDSPIPGTTPAQTAGRVPAQTTPTTTTSNKAAPTTTTTTSPPTSTTSTTVSPPIPAPTSNWYGSGIKGHGLRPRAATTTEFALGPIKVPSSGNIGSLALYFIFASEGNYFAGTGGINRVSIRDDVGGQPGSTILGEFTIANPTASGGIWSDWADRRGNWSHYPFDRQIPVAGGARYWIVVENLHPDPAANWVGINALTAGGGAPGTVYVHIETSSSSSTFEPYSYPGEGQFTGLFDLKYTDGRGFGQGYLHAFFDQSVGGGRQAREVIVPTATRNVTSLRIWAPRTSGSGDLTVALSSGGNELARASASGSGWLAFPLSATLQAGTTYHLEFSAPADTAYTFSALRETGTWSSGSRFTDGYADYHDGSNWLGGWPIWGSTRQEGDLMFYFTQ